MYEDFYQLEKAPFAVTPDPEFLFATPTHKEAFASIVYGIERRKGFVVIAGEVGLGKTTILRSYLESRDRERVAPVCVFNPNVSFKELLDTIYRELDIPSPSNDLAAMVDGLHRALIDHYRLGRNIVLIVDEAQNMPVETLEQLRVLSNIETHTDKLLQIVLVGQIELAETLERHQLRQLKQRVAVRATLLPLTNRESFAYIGHRLSRAGASGSPIFTKAALRRIVRHARGIPRTLNIICDNALVTGFGYQARPVTARIVKEVIGDLDGTRRARRGRWMWAAIAVLATVVAVAAVWRVRHGAAVAPWRIVSAGVAAPREMPPQAAVIPPPAAALAAETSPAQEAEIVAVRDTRPVPDPLPAMEPDSSRFVVRVVKPGDGLLQMAKDVYGFATSEMLRRVLESNPSIGDPNHILVGTRVRFPAQAGAAQPIRVQLGGR